MDFEHHNAELWRLYQQDLLQFDKQKQATESLSRATERLTQLLEKREIISKEMGSADRAAQVARAELKQRNADKEKSMERMQVAKLQRFRDIQDMDQGEGIRDDGDLWKMINIEKARQMIGTARDSLLSTATSRPSLKDPAVEFLSKLDHIDPRQRLIIRKDSSGHTRREKSPVKVSTGHNVTRPSRPANTSPSRRSRSLPQTHRPIISIPDHQVKLEQLNQRVRARNQSLKSRPPRVDNDPEDIRRSIESIRKSYDRHETERPMSPIGAERFDPAKRIERKRAALAALKLKPRPR